MKNRRKDTLLNAAFDCQTTVSDLTPEEKAELAHLASIKEVLVSLKNVPECQLSSDRLRDAILNKGVKRKSSLGWTTMVATAACAVVGVLFVNQIREVEPSQQVALNEKTSPAVLNSIPENSLELFSTDVKDKESVLPKNDALPVMRSIRKSHGANPSRSTKSTILLALNTTPIEEDVEIVSAGFGTASSSASGVVVVDSAYLAETGAYEAVELEAFGDVVFGG